MKKTKVAFMDPDSRLYEINRMGSNDPVQKLTADELMKLQALMPETKWIVVEWVDPLKLK